MKHLLVCHWCNIPYTSYYQLETLCSDCDCQLLEYTHPIFSTIEAEELLLNGFSKEDLARMIDLDVSYLDALRTLKSKCNELIDSFYDA